MTVLTQERITFLENLAQSLRADSLKFIHKRGSGHPGGALSAAEIMAVLYFQVLRIDPKNPGLDERDRFILSKGHASAVLYAALIRRGFFDKARGAIVCNLRPGFSYAEDYLADCVMFFQVPGVALQGKACRFAADADGRIVPTGAECEHRMVRAAPSGTIAIVRPSLSPEALHTLLTHHTFTTPDDAIYSTYRYNCCEAPAQAAHAGGAPWTLRVRG